MAEDKPHSGAQAMDKVTLMPPSPSSLLSSPSPPSPKLLLHGCQRKASAEDQAETLVHVSLGTSYPTFLTFPDSEITSGAFQATNSTQWSDTGTSSLPKYVCGLLSKADGESHNRHQK